MAACFSVASARNLRPILSLSVRLAPGVRHALLHPRALGAGPLLQAGAGVGVLLVGLAGVPPRDLALLEVGRVAAAVDVDLLLGQVELDDPGDRPGEELAVVADEHGAGAQPGDEPLQPVQPVEVEVVGRLVEQEDVVAAEQQRGEARAGRLAAGQRGHRRGRGRRASPSSAATAVGALVEVGAAEGEPALERLARTRRPRRGVPSASALRGRVHRGLRRGRRRCAGPGTSPDGLARAPLGLLRQVADVGRARAQLDRAVLGTLQAGEHRAAASTCPRRSADQADDVAGGDDQVETGEQRAVAVPGGERAGDQGCAHSVNGTRPGCGVSAVRMATWTT